MSIRWDTLGNPPVGRLPKFSMTNNQFFPPLAGSTAGRQTNPNDRMTKSHTRKQIRLKKYDYSQPGYYFVTICTQNRKNMFGEIKNGQMVLNNIGLLVKKYWNKLIDKFNIELDKYIIMPNHIHGIIVINNNGRTHVDDNGRTHGSAPTTGTTSSVVGRPMCRPTSIIGKNNSMV